MTKENSDIPDSLEEINLRMNATADDFLRFGTMHQLPKQLSALLKSGFSYFNDTDMSEPNGGRIKPQFGPVENGCVEHDGLMMPAYMSDELKTLNVYIDQTTFDSLESTRRMLALCEESKEAGIKTLVMLDDQGEQLERVEGNLDTINTDMKEAEEHLKGMEKCCGLCILPCMKNDDFEKNSEYAKTWKKDDDGGVISDQPRITVGDNGMGPQGGYITRITNDAREDEMDENIQQVSTMVGNLRNMAIDMSTEVSNQNRQLDRIQEKAQSNETRVDSANKRAHKLITK